MMTTQLWRKCANELAAMIRSKEVSSREVVQSHLDRIAAVNGKVNAITVTLAESALLAADRADSTAPIGPLHGVPFTIKENIDCTGSATTQGLPALAAAMPAADAPVVARMKAAGAIPLGRTNLPEMGLRITTDNPLRGRTLNPWDPTRTAGGSSGGEGAALATGMSPIGLGNDIGGSLRNPAYCCGITALKSTTGRIPMVLSIPAAAQPISFRMMCVEGPMARSVADLKIAYRLLAGWHPNDPFSAPAALDGPAARKKAAIVTQMPFSTLPDSTVAAIRKAGEVLAAAGWEVEEAVPPELARVNEIWAHVLNADLQQALPLLTPVMSERALVMLRGLLRKFDPSSKTITEIYTERDRLVCRVVGVLPGLPGRHRANVGGPAVPARCGPRSRHRHRDHTEAIAVHHAGQPAGDTVSCVAHRHRGWNADGRAGLRRALARGLVSRCRKRDRGAVGSNHADRSGGVGRHWLNCRCSGRIRISRHASKVVVSDCGPSAGRRSPGWRQRDCARTSRGLKPEPPGVESAPALPRRATARRSSRRCRR